MRVGAHESMAGVAEKTSQLATDPKRRLISAAHEFEGQMLKELLTPLISGDSLADEGSEDTGILKEFGAEALGKGLSEQGGFGIANHIVSRFCRNGNPPGTER